MGGGLNKLSKEEEKEEKKKGKRKINVPEKFKC